jgi:hypothetical protein
MKLQHRINDNDGPNWYRCKQVEFTGETAIWELSRTGKYGLLAAYQMAPHRQLVQAVDDVSLRAFVKAWGPLRINLTPNEWAGSDPIPVYRRQRDTFRTWVLLLTAIQKNEGLHNAVIDLLQQDSDPSITTPILDHLRFPNTGFDGTAWERLAGASKKEIIWICEYLLGSFPLTSLTHSFAIRQTPKGLDLTARPVFLGLMDALYWMVWQDIFRDNPFQFCVECGKLIPSTSRHARRFCPDGCAHRRTGREWQQRKRDNERKSNGTQKAR